MGSTMILSYVQAEPVSLADFVWWVFRACSSRLDMPLNWFEFHVVNAPAPDGCIDADEGGE